LKLFFEKDENKIVAFQMRRLTKLKVIQPIEKPMIKNKISKRSITKKINFSILIATTLMLLTSSLGSTAWALGPLTNTPTTEAAMSVLIPAAPVLEHNTGGVVNDVASPIGGGDCLGSVHSASYALGGGLWLYAYELENRCGPNWDVGYAGAGGGLKVALNGNVPLFFVANADANPNDDAFHTTDQGFAPYGADFANFNAGNIFGTFAGDFTTAIVENANDVEIFNGDGIFLTGDIAGFVTGSPPVLLRGTHLGGSTTVFDLVVPSQVILIVSVDIKPGSFPNSINTRSMGVVPVAILGSDTFDVTDVDVTTLMFGTASPAHDLTDSDTYDEHLQDVNDDGFLDLVSHYKQKETGIACGNTEETLTGALLDGTPIEGIDSVNPKGC